MPDVHPVADLFRVMRKSPREFQFHKQVAEAAIARSEAALKQAQADESYATGNFHRIKPLLTKGYVTEDDVRKACTTADAKTAAVDQAKSQLPLAKASLLSASAQKQQAIAQISQSQAEVKESAHSVLVLAPLLAQRERQASAVRLARYNYEQCSVIAPFDARITNLTISRDNKRKWAGNYSPLSTTGTGGCSQISERPRFHTLAPEHQLTYSLSPVQRRSIAALLRVRALASHPTRM